jgi:hypothetical protein
VCLGVFSGAPSAPSVAAQAQTTPARLVLNAGSRPDQQLDVTAQVLTADGHGVANVAVTFALSGGAVTPATVTSDASGFCQGGRPWVEHGDADRHRRRAVGVNDRDRRRGRRCR